MVFVIIPVGLIASLCRCMARNREEDQYQVVQQPTTQVVCVTRRTNQQTGHPSYQPQYVPQQQVYVPQQPHPSQYQPCPPRPPPYQPQAQQHPQPKQQPSSGSPTQLDGRPQRRRFFQKRDKNGYAYTQVEN